MSFHPTRWFLCHAALLAVIAGSLRADELPDYKSQIKPLMARRCYSCHGALKQEAGLRVDTAALIRQGGDGGPLVEPGKSDESLLIDAVTGTNGVTRMPPKEEGEPLKPEEIALLRAWIDQGAPSPADELPQADPRQHWAFQRIERPAVPAVQNAPWVRNPIDAFIATGLEQHQLAPNIPADRGTLLRRVYLDLIGLPPTRAELTAFLNDPAPDAYECVVNRLLESPQYGERWARHWMDVWRYSDWYGRRAVPDVWNSAPQVWRWRDWIVQSLNVDKGYDRMVQEMLAADELCPEDDQAAVATGYIIRNWYALNPHQWMKDTVEHTGKAFLGLTFNCAHCHDHKYDPLKQEEYFRFRAFFEPVQVRQDRWPGEADPGPFQKYEYTVLRKVVSLGSVRIFDESLNAETFMYRMGDERDRFPDKPAVTPGSPAFLHGDQLPIAPVSIPPMAQYPGLKPFIREAETAARSQGMAAALATLKTAQQNVVAELAKLSEIESQQLAALNAAPANASESVPLDPKLMDRRKSSQSAMHQAQQAAELAAAHFETERALAESLRARIAADDVRYLQHPGDADALAKVASHAERAAALRAAEEKQLAARHAAEKAKQAADSAPVGMEKDKAVTASQAADQQLTAAGQAVEAAKKALEGESTTYSPLTPVYPATSSGRRLALARWITHRDNPLAARVAVNHIWLRHFGRAIVDSTFDLGVNGKPPSHRELLDWLAAELMEPSQAAAAAGAQVAAGTWKMKHLHRLIVTSNAYRQTAIVAQDEPRLAADPDNRWLWRFNSRRVESEVLRDCALYASGELDLRLGGAPVANEQEADSKRRSLYFSVHPEDGGHPRFLATFDAPDPCDCYKRAESMIPQQALAMTNSQIMLNQSRLLGQRLWDEVARQTDNPEARQSLLVNVAFEQILSRPPTAAEAALCREFLSRQVALLEKQTGPVTAQAVQGAVAPASDPMIRASESLVRSLFNHHDFVTLR